MGNSLRRAAPSWMWGYTDMVSVPERAPPQGRWRRSPGVAGQAFLTRRKNVRPSLQPRHSSSIVPGVGARKRRTVMWESSMARGWWVSKLLEADQTKGRSLLIERLVEQYADLLAGMDDTELSLEYLYKVPSDEYDET